MIKTLNVTRILLAVSAIATVVMTACENNTEPAPEAQHAVPGGSNPGSTGIVKENQVPTAAQVSAMEAAIKLQKMPEVPLASAGAALPKTAVATDYTINFNDFTALSLISDHAYTTVTTFYISNVRYGVYAYTFPLDGGHFHLPYENPNDCYADNTSFVPSGKYGIMSGGKCVVQGDAATQPRTVLAHGSTSQLQTYVWDGSTKYVFDLKSIQLLPNGGDASANHVQIWIHKIDVGWRYWADLASGPSGYTWFFPQTGTGGAQGIDEIHVASPTPSTASAIPTYDNLAITVH